ncbi:MAG: hypothetical protein ACI9UK_000962 [Candidatus Krumholzibacteriia bacterium]|jgi:hypothetical protein
MGKPKGCLQIGCLGILAFVALILIILGINLAVVVNRNGDEELREEVLTSESAPSDESVAIEWSDPKDENKPLAGLGRVVLELNQGEFHLHPGKPGDGVLVKASYDANIYELNQFGHTWADSSWVYQLRFRRTISGLQAMLSGIMDGNDETSIHIYLPPDLPFELNVLVNQGGLEADVGGLWLTDIDLRMRQGGISFEVSEPLRQPLGTFSLHGRMGGGEIQDLGNASPRVVDIGFNMGGVALDLSGEWLNDCDATLAVKMGGMEVAVPRNLTYDKSAEANPTLIRTDEEVPKPTLRVTQKTNMGEIEFR